MTDVEKKVDEEIINRDALRDADEEDDLSEVEKMGVRYRQTMAIMVRFYENGTLKKERQWKESEEELNVARVHLDMVNAQLKALKDVDESKTPDIINMSKAVDGGMRPNPAPEAEADDSETYTIDGCPMTHLNKQKGKTVGRNTNHPTLNGYEDELIAEKEQLERLIGEGETQAKEFQMLHEWSKGIVKAVRWLHSNLEQYLVEVLGCAPNPLAPPKPEALSKEDVAKHQKGLEEITRNLEESQDYFKATLDGRLQAFHEVEKAGIEAQLAAIRQFPEDNPRRVAVEAKLEADLKTVTGSLTEKKPGHAQKMTDMHKDFWDVLLWEKEKLQKQLDG